MFHANLACMWSSLAAAGARCPWLAGSSRPAALLRHIEAAVPGARITVIASGHRPG